MTERYLTITLRPDWQGALRADLHLRAGLNCCQGQVTHPAVAEALGYPLTAAERLLA